MKTSMLWQTISVLSFACPSLSKALGDDANESDAGLARRFASTSAHSPSLLPVFEKRDRNTAQISLGFEDNQPNLPDDIQPVDPSSLSNAERLVTPWMIPEALERLDYQAPVSPTVDLMFEDAEEFNHRRECPTGVPQRPPLTPFFYENVRDNLVVHAELRVLRGDPFAELDMGNSGTAIITPMQMTLPAIIQARWQNGITHGRIYLNRLNDGIATDTSVMTWYIGLRDDPCASIDGLALTDSHLPTLDDDFCNHNLCGLMKLFFGKGFR